jgi:hypothetical protein
MSTYNEEAERLRDLPGDEEDDDMGEEELEELFGRGSGAAGGEPIDLEVDDGAEDQGDDGEQDENGDDGEQVGNGSCSVSRLCTSDVWDDFRKLFRKGPKGKMVRYVVVCIHCCIHCKKQYYGRSSIGTDHLRRHRDKCAVRREKTRSFSQS